MKYFNYSIENRVSLQCHTPSLKSEPIRTQKWRSHRIRSVGDARSVCLSGCGSRPHSFFMCFLCDKLTAECLHQQSTSGIITPLTTPLQLTFLCLPTLFFRLCSVHAVLVSDHRHITIHAHRRNYNNQQTPLRHSLSSKSHNLLFGHFKCMFVWTYFVSQNSFFWFPYKLLDPYKF